MKQFTGRVLLAALALKAFASIPLPKLGDMGFSRGSDARAGAHFRRRGKFKGWERQLREAR